MSAPQRLRERLPEGGFIIHAEAAHGDDYTLCGYAYEGSCDEASGDHGVEVVARGKVSCRSCVRIIRYCKAFPARMLADVQP